MKLFDLAQFIVDSVHREETGAVAIGRFSRLTGVRDQGWLFRSDRPSMIGDLSRVPVSTYEPVEFRSPNDEFVTELVVGYA